MTSMAVTASNCASASEAALLLATFMPTSLDLGMTHRGANAPIDGQIFYPEHPHTIFRFDESPLCEYRRAQGRPVMRRHFGSVAAGLCAPGGILKCIPESCSLKASGAGGCPGVGARYCCEPSLPRDEAACHTVKSLGRTMARIDYCDTSKSNERTREILG